MIFKFCPKCSGDLTRKSENLLVCQKCKFELYLNPKPTNAAILENEKGEILLVKRKIPPKEGFWDLPGGFVEVGESAEEAIVREVKEELGISEKKFGQCSLSL